MTDELTGLPDYPFPVSSPLEPPGEFARLRGSEPVSRVRLETGEPAWLLTRYADIRSALADPKLTTWFPGMEAGAATEDSSGLLFMMNGPTHLRLRRLVTKSLTHRRVEDLRPGANRMAVEFLAAMTQAGPPVDLIDGYAAPLACGVLAELLGVPGADRDSFRSWANGMLAVFSAPNPEELAQAGERLPAYLSDLIDAKRHRPGDDLLS